MVESPPVGLFPRQRVDRAVAPSQNQVDLVVLATRARNLTPVDRCYWRPAADHGERLMSTQRFGFAEEMGVDRAAGPGPEDVDLVGVAACRGWRAAGYSGQAELPGPRVNG